VQDVDLRGETLLDVDLLVPAAARAAAARPPRVRVTALLDGVQLRPVAGLPPIGTLRGTLGFTAGHLQPSTLTGQWLGGPVTLGVGERSEPGVTALAIGAAVGTGAIGGHPARDPSAQPGFDPTRGSKIVAKGCGNPTGDPHHEGMRVVNSLPTPGGWIVTQLNKTFNATCVLRSNGTSVIKSCPGLTYWPTSTVRCVTRPETGATTCV